MNWQKANWHKVHMRAFARRDVDAHRIGRQKPNLFRLDGMWFCWTKRPHFHLGSGATPIEAYLDWQYR